MKKLFIFIFLIFVIQSYGGDRVIKEVLPNGVTVLFKETKGMGIIAGSIFIKGGSIEDPEGKKGLTNLTLSMLLKGSKNFSAFDINKVFEDSGGYIGTSTSEEYSTIEFALRTQDIKDAFNVIKDILFNPLFPEDKLEIEKRNIIAALRAKKEEGFSYAYDMLRKEIYKNTPYQYSPGGDEDDVKNINKNDIEERWKELLEGGRVVVSLVGDIPYKEIKRDIEEVFKGIKKGDFSYKVYTYKITGEYCKSFKREGAQTTILVAYNAPTAKDKEYFAMKVLNGILGSGFTSRLFQTLREEEGLAYAVGSFFPTRVNMGRLIAYIGTAPENEEKAVKGIREVIKSVEKGISEEEIKTAKEKIIGHFLLEHQTRAKQSWYLGWFETIGLGYQMDKNYTTYINNVKEKDILEAYKKYIPEGNVCVIVKP
jgi:predicted Zn-dependent peptidase